MGRVLSGLAILFLVLDAATKLLALPVVVQANAQLGYSADLVRVLGTLLFACTVVYVIPRTAVLGAVLLTAYLGGAVASHLRMHDPLVSHVLFGVYVGAAVWAGLYLRDPRLRRLLPFRDPTPA